MQFEYWAGIDEAYEFEAERAAFYGMLAGNLAAKIRNDIDAGGGDSTCLTHLTTIIEQRRQQFKRNSNSSLIPDLKQLFEAEQHGDRSEILTLPD